MSEEGRENIQKSNRLRNLTCGKCGSTATETVSGEKIGGLAGIQYKYCGACGWSRAIVKRQSPKALLRQLG